MRSPVLTLALLLIVAPAPVRAQNLPVTTESEEARMRFEEGREDWSHWGFAEARNRFDAAIAADPGFALAYLHLAWLHLPWLPEGSEDLKRRYLELAERSADQLTAAERKLMEASRAILLDGERDRGVEILRGLMAEFTDDPYLPGLIGMTYLNTDNAAAESAFAVALERDPGFVPAHLHLGVVAGKQDDLVAAHEHLEEYARRAPRRWTAYFFLGFANLKQERFDAAAEQVERALATSSVPESSELLLKLLGYARLGAGKYAEAEWAFRENVERHPASANAYCALGDLYLQTDRYQEALVQFERALQLDPDIPSARLDRLRAWIQLANRGFEETFARRDATALAGLFTEEAQLLPPGQGPVNGRDDIALFWQGAFDEGLTGATLETTEVVPGVDEEVATEVGRYRLLTGDRDTEAGNYVVIWRLTPEGWRLHRGIWNSERRGECHGRRS